VFEKIIKNKNALTLILSTIIFIIVLWLSQSSISYTLNKKIQHRSYTIKNTDARISKDILIVEIDDKTLESEEL